MQSEKVQLLPEQLEARISDKQFLTAVDILQDALRLIRNSSLENIGALADLRVYLNNQETVYPLILINWLVTKRRYSLWQTYLSKNYMTTYT